MTAGAIPTSRPKAADPPQYATFDVSKKEEGEDSLPAMPTWGDSESKRLEAEADSVELRNLRKPESNGANQPLMNGMSPAATPGATTPVGQNARSPYGPQGAQAAASGYMGAGSGASAYGTPAPPYNQMHNGYDQSQASYHTGQSWGITGGQDYGQMPGPSPTEYGYNQSPVQTPGYDEHGAYSEYGMQGNGPVQPATDQYGVAGAQPERRGPPRGAVGAVGGAGPRASPAPRGSPAPPPQQDYGFGGGQFDAPPRTYSPAPVQQTFSPAPPQRTFSPAPQRTFSPGPQRNFSPGPQRNFSPGPGGPQRQFSADSAPGPGRRPMPPRGQPFRQFSADSAPNPQRQYSSSSPRPLAGGGGPGGRPGPGPGPRRQYTADAGPAPSSPGPMNNGGFDFQSGFSRPPARANTFDTSYNGGGGGGGGGGQQEEPAAYPGYKPYQPKR
ncbi:hypothetical protein J7T55_008413 [Diaporthe amygdali]|uniref:uncharacterized protein n=1 Tax=Phomopsis amygdali TaxID=1214568 RepID=UPI0022FE2A9C|nr:uncharacterized protein J7T55_008413 [Diaporthe amygdali]KAJ0121250.1 hypothetical protein J7T55_008413 [Diaporthe amygdali]